MNAAPCTLKFPGDEEMEFVSKTDPTSERQCEKGGPCTAIWDEASQDYICSKCRKAMGPAVVPPTPKIDNARSCDLVIQARLTAIDTWRLIASFVETGQIFRDREELEMYISNEIILRINGHEAENLNFGWARQVMETHMPDVAKRLGSKRLRRAS